MPHEELHFLKNEKIIHQVNLEMASEKGAHFCTNNRFIKRGRDYVRFHLIQVDKSLVIRDLTEEFQVKWRF